MTDEPGFRSPGAQVRYREILDRIPGARDLEAAHAPGVGGQLLFHVVIASGNVTTVGLRMYDIDRELRRAVTILRLDPELGVALEVGQRRQPISVFQGGLEYRWAHTGSFEAVLQAYGQVETWGLTHPFAVAAIFAVLLPGWNLARRLTAAVFRWPRPEQPEVAAGSKYEHWRQQDEEPVLTFDDRGVPILDAHQRVADLAVMLRENYVTEVRFVEEAGLGPRFARPSSDLAIAMYAIGLDGTVIMIAISQDNPTWRK